MSEPSQYTNTLFVLRVVAVVVTLVGEKYKK